MLVDFGAGFGAGKCDGCAALTHGEKRLFPLQDPWTSEPRISGCVWWYAVSICTTDAPFHGVGYGPAYGIVSWWVYLTGQFRAWRWHVKVVQFWNQPIQFLYKLMNVGCFDWEFHYESDLFDHLGCLDPFGGGALTLNRAVPFGVVRTRLAPPLCLSDPPCDADPSHAPATVTLRIADRWGNPL